MILLFRGGVRIRRRKRERTFMPAALQQGGKNQDNGYNVNGTHDCSGYWFQRDGL